MRKVIRKNLDKRYDECMLYGMISYVVPHRVWPTGYHCERKEPLMMAALSSHKEFFTVYLMSVYSDKSERAWFEAAWKKSGKKLRLGGCCVRFRKVEDAALEVIGEAIRRIPTQKYIGGYVATLASTGRGPDGKKLRDAKPPKQASTKKVASKRASAKKPVK